jgi:hypothetical protein
MADNGLTWNKAWQQAERELGTWQKARTWQQGRARRTSWPYVVLGVSIGIVTIGLPILMVASLILVGYGSMTDGEALFINGLGIVVIVSWVAIPVSVAVIAFINRHSKSALTVAGVGIAAWVVVNVWMFAGTG